jgi:DNA-binding CsgD family transcriptional regulator
MNDVTPPREVVTLLAELTSCETRVLRESHSERTLQQIADRLKVGIEAIRSHRKSCLRKWLAIIGESEGGCTACRKMLHRVLPYLPSNTDLSDT